MQNIGPFDPVSTWTYILHNCWHKSTLKDVVNIFSTSFDGKLHYDIIKWKHFRRYWTIVWGIYRSLVNSPHKGKWCGALRFSLICAWIKSWVNDHEAGHLRRYCTHYDVIVLVPHNIMESMVYFDAVNNRLSWVATVTCPTWAQGCDLNIKMSSYE